MISDIEIIGTNYYIKISYKNLFFSDYSERIVLRKLKIDNSIPNLEEIIGDIIQSDTFPIYISSRLFGISIGDKISTTDIPSDSIIYFLYQNKLSINECLKQGITFEAFTEYYYEHDYFNLMGKTPPLLVYDDLSTITTFINAINSIIFNESTTLFIDAYIANPSDFANIQDKEFIDTNIPIWSTLPPRTKHRINMLIFQEIYKDYIVLPYYGFKDITQNILTGASSLYDTDIEQNCIYIYQIATIPKLQNTAMDASDVFRSTVITTRASDLIQIKPAHLIYNSLYNRFINFDIVRNGRLNPIYINNSNYEFLLHRQFINTMLKSIKGFVDEHLQI